MVRRLASSEMSIKLSMPADIIRIWVSHAKTVWYAREKASSIDSPKTTMPWLRKNITYGNHKSGSINKAANQKFDY